MKLIIRGIVQGVGFRPTAYRVARELGLKGYVMNRGSYVEVAIDGKHEEFIRRLKEELPSTAVIDRIEILDDGESYAEFRIIESRYGDVESIPVDSAVCAECLREIFDPANRRYMYPFTSCTRCGERFSLIYSLPYDRERTSMRDFPMCEDCRREFEDPENRRFHHQTICCPRCGPKYTLYDSDGRMIDGEIREFAHLIDEGSLGVAKSWGGMHLICTFDQIHRARRLRRREEKPFAAMFRDVKTLEKYVELDEHERELLQSKERPIVVVKKRSMELEQLSPGLGNVGVYIPYSPFHHILFHHLKSDGVVMTSANPPGDPMFIDEGVMKLGAEYYLLHNRKIVNRVDDSVVRVYGGNKFFLRRGRGYSPFYMDVDYKSTILGVGAEENVSISMSKNRRLHISQYIGNARSYETVSFFRSALKYMKSVLGIEKFDCVGVDMHPRYSTRKIGEENGEIFEIQHHWAHASSLLLDHGVEEGVILTLDGAGYGADGRIWGGEVIHASFSSFERVGALEYIPLIGGDAAVKDPRRMMFAISEIAGIDFRIFDDHEAEILRKLMRISPLTSSFGRVLDAISCWFGVCCKRTYEGEPAMKLERLIESGKNMYPIEVEVKGGRVLTTKVFEQAAEHPKDADLAYSMVNALIRGLMKIAVDHADRKGVKYLGISGGVSYNSTIVNMAERIAAENGFAFLTHRRIPNGDGGIAAGQNAIVGHKMG